MQKFFSSTTAWWFLLIAIIGDFAIPYILAPFYKSYNHKTMVMSVLGNPDSPVRVYYNIWLVTLGLLLSASVFTIYYKYSHVSKSLSIAIVVMIAIFAIGAGVLSGIFSVNETKDMETVSSKIHGFGAALGFMVLCFVPLMLAILSFINKERAKGIVCLISFILALLFFILFVMADKPEFQDTTIAYGGLWQRLTLFFMYVPLGYTAVQGLVALSYKN